MRNMSIVMLVIAVVLGGFAVIGVRALILSNSQQVQQVQVEPQVVLSSIVVANTMMEFGEEITPAMVREIPWAAEARPVGTFETVAEMLAGETRMVLRAISPGQLVLADHISGAGERATLSQVIATGMRAVSIRINEVSGAAGFILPGDYVDVLLTVNADRDREQAAVHVILQNILVLAIDQIADERQGGAQVARVATLEVGIEDGQRIALASSVGTISLALRNVEGSATAIGDQTRTIRYTDLDPNSGQESGFDGLASRDSAYTMMVVTRETESSSQRVIRDQEGEASEPDLLSRIGGTQ